MVHSRQILKDGKLCEDRRKEGRGATRRKEKGKTKCMQNQRGFEYQQDQCN